jgi:hypothetical protein
MQHACENISTIARNKKMSHCITFMHEPAPRFLPRERLRLPKATAVCTRSLSVYPVPPTTPS